MSLLAYLGEMSFYSGLFAGTSFALNAEQQSILNNLLTEGFCPVMPKRALSITFTASLSSSGVICIRSSRKAGPNVFGMPISLYHQFLQTAGTSFALNAEQQSILNNLLTEGYRWIIWRGYMDVNALDRQLFHNAPIHKALAIGYAASSLKKGSTPGDVQKMDDFLNDNFPPQPAQGTAFTGQKHFWDRNSSHRDKPARSCRTAVAARAGGSSSRF